MLNRLMEFGIKENFFEIMPLGELPKSCCTNPKTDVIDFDKTKEIVSEKYEFQQPKSVDALKILPHLNRIDFIELKGFEEFCNRNKNHDNVDKTVNRQIEKFNLLQKIQDSLHLFWFLINQKKFECTKAEFKQFENVKKCFIVVIDIDLYENPMKDRLATMVLLSESPTSLSLKRSILDKLNNTIDNIPASSLENLERPQLMNCRTIDSHYSALNLTPLV